MRTGVYGGTFNPIHRGHVHILREFIKRLDLQRVLLIPDGTPPHKRAEDLAPPEDRVEMCRLAVKELDIVEISQMELARPGKSFTSDTLTELHGLYPRDELYFLMGEDMFLTVDKWHDAPTIFRLAVLCASPRSPEGYKRLLEKEKELIGLCLLYTSAGEPAALLRAGRDRGRPGRCERHKVCPILTPNDRQEPVYHHHPQARHHGGVGYAVWGDYAGPGHQ